KFGATGTSMPPFILMPDDQLNALVDYVTYLSKRGEFERELLVRYSEELWTEEELKDNDDPVTDVAEETIEQLNESWESAGDAVVESEVEELPNPQTPEFEQSVTRGREIFLGPVVGCTKCHGADGKSVSKLSAADALDVWGNVNPPRDLTL